MRLFAYFLDAKRPPTVPWGAFSLLSEREFLELSTERPQGGYRKQRAEDPALPSYPLACC